MKNSKKIINEAIMQVSLDNLLGTNFSNEQKIQMLMFSPSWTNEFQNSTWKFIFGDDISRDNIAKIFNQMGIECSMNQNTSDLFQAQLKVPSKMQGMIMKNLAPKLPAKTQIRFKNGFMVIVASKNIVKLALATAYSITNGIDMSSGQLANDTVEKLFASNAQSVQSTENNYTLVANGPFTTINGIAKEENLTCEYNKLVANDSIVDETTKQLLAFMKNAYNGYSSFDAMVADMRVHKVSQLLGILANINNMVESHQMNGTKHAIVDFKTPAEFDTYVHSVFSSKINESMPDENNVSNPLARRRMKLFKDVKHYGGKVYSNAGWICAICETYEQDHVFGRYKPMVDENGNIIEYANKRDDELDELVKNGKITDDERRNYIAIRDGKGKVVTEGEYSAVHLTETYWCTTGARSEPKKFKWQCDGEAPGFWYNYNWKIEGTQQSTANISMEYRNPYWVFMNLKTGVLFQYSRFTDYSKLKDYMMDENDRTTDGAGTTEHGETSLASVMVSKYPDFKALFDALSPASKEALQIIDRMNIGDDGAMIIDKRLDSTTLSFLSSPFCPTKLRINMKNASHLFENVAMPTINEIDMTMVENASYMFSNAKLSRRLVLHGTSNCTSMESMFLGSNGLVNVIGLDTSKAKTIYQMFLDAKSQNDLDMKIPTLDLRSCTNIKYAFKGSDVYEINLKNTDNVSSVKNFFGQNKHLSKLPNLTFKKIFKISSLFDNFTLDDILDPLKGCDKLLNQDYDSLFDEMTKVVQFYTMGSKQRVLEMVDNDGFFVIDSRQAVYEISNMTNFIKKIRLSPEANDDIEESGIPLFKHVKLNSCEVIDVSQVKNGKHLLAYADLTNVKQLIGLGHFTDCYGMFDSTIMSKSINEYDLSGAKTLKYIFGSNTKIERLPNIKVGKNLEEICINPLDVFNTGSRSYIETNVNASYDEVKEWLRSIQQEQLDAITKNLFNNGKLLISSQTKQLLGYEYDIVKIKHDEGVFVNGNPVNEIVIQGQDSICIFNNHFIDGYDHSGLLWRSFKDTPETFILKLPKITLDGVTNVRNMFKKSGYCGKKLVCPYVEINGMGNVEIADAMFSDAGGSIDVQHLKFDSLASIKSAQSMIYGIGTRNGQSTLSIDAPYDFINIEVGTNMFNPYCNTTIEMNGGNFPRLEHAHNLEQMFCRISFRQPLNLGDFIVLADANCNNMFAGATNISAKSVSFMNGKDCFHIFGETNFVPGTILKKIYVKTTDICNGMFCNTMGIDQIGLIKVETLNSNDKVIIQGMTFYFNDLKSIGFIDIKNLDAAQSSALGFCDEILKWYGCTNMEDLSGILTVIHELVA